MNSIKQYRIISLVPSITELLYDLGLTENIVGITRAVLGAVGAGDVAAIRPAHPLQLLVGNNDALLQREFVKCLHGKIKQPSVRTFILGRLLVLANSNPAAGCQQMIEESRLLVEQTACGTVGFKRRNVPAR